jgi:hypothetical protein
MGSIILPEKFGIAKVVQLIIDGEPILAGREFSKESWVRHMEILGATLISRGIEPEIDPEDSTVIARRGDRFTAPGMGKCKKEGLIYVFGGFSTDYRVDQMPLMIDIRHLEMLKRANPGFEYRMDSSFY